jgi:hypothetical protein
MKRRVQRCLRSVALLACALAGIVAGGCTKTPGPPAASKPPVAVAASAARAAADHSASDRFFDPKENPGAVIGVPLDPSKLTPSELQFGIAPKRDPRVTYAPDVIVMEEGDKAIKSAASDGMTWVFDAAAPHVSEFEPGKIIFATGRAVGRIGQMVRNGATVTVKFAPVQITEVIQEGHFLVNSPFRTQDMIIYTAPDFPSIVDLNAPPPNAFLDEAGEGEPRLMRAVYIPTPNPDTGTPLAAAAASIGGGAPLSLGRDAFKVYPLWGSDATVGAEYDYNGKGVHVKASGGLKLGATTIRFVLDITHGSIQKFGMEMGGVAGVVFGFEANTTQDRIVNIDMLGELPVDMTLPIAIAGVPLSLTVFTRFELKTGFSAKSSMLSAKAEYSLTGTLFAGWQKDGPPIEPKLTPKAEIDYGNSVAGISVGINSLDVHFGVAPMVGIGAFGFSTGVYAGLSFGGGALKQSDIVMRDCRAGYVNGAAFAGVGYKLPGPVVAFVNTLLSSFTSYRFPKHGSLISVGPVPVLNESTQIPKNCSTPR